MTLSEAVSEAHDCLRDGHLLSETVLRRLLEGIAYSECALAEAKKDNHRLHLKLDESCDAEELRQVRAELTEAKKDSARLKLELAALGDLAVGNWDDATVGRVDAAVEGVKYRDQLRTIFKDKARLDWLENGGGATDVFIDRDPPMYSIRLWPKTGPGPQYDGESLRAAIDYAKAGK